MSIRRKITKKGEQVFLEQEEWKIGEEFNMGCGSVELKKTKKAGLHVVRYSGSGNFTYVLKLHKDGDYILGANYGHRKKSPEEEKEPIKRVLRELEIPLSVLTESDDGSWEVGSRWYDDHHCPVGRNTNSWHSDGSYESISEAEHESPQGYFQGGGYSRGRITGATYAFSVLTGRTMNGSRWKRVSEIIVSRKVDLPALVKRLKEEL